ncbi:MAG TPA: sigma-54-dependent Fis family transcriptional regulator [Caldithrix abyssi]|uniref:Sigma-54-dependent Fis family transcriptional regulator n=1 Tax=Caldithrix abyssi TaxID=187145 RepID=A0A7V5VEI3_CALAY|nr:sigma-54-dependent Fis family transcriptional regulator [Caldithrix abyssi]
MAASVLVVDNEKRMCALIQGTLEMEPDLSVQTAYSGDQALSLLNSSAFDIVLTDLKMSPMDGLTLLKKIKEDFPATDVLLMTAYASQETAVEAMQSGAFDYLIKPFSMDELLLRIRRILRQRALEKENARLREKELQTSGMSGIVGKSKKMRQVFDMIHRVAEKEATVLIRGESGTGKELIARAIHAHSPRKDKPWIAINCAALPETLLESELFGYEKGAFTGAVSAKPGLFERANGGTLFLDEIGDLPLSLQSKLLRVLQNREVIHLGGHKPIPIDVRLITATHQNLEAMIEKQTFRADLYYRINLFPISLPALRERKEDIPELIEFIMRDYPDKIMHPRAKLKLMQYDFPGNIRELRNIIERAAILSENMIEDVDLPVSTVPLNRETTSSEGGQGLLPKEGLVLDEHLEQLLREALRRAPNKSEAARLLGITRRRLYSMMEKFNIGK